MGIDTAIILIASLLGLAIGYIIGMINILFKSQKRIERSNKVILDMLADNLKEITKESMFYTNDISLPYLYNDETTEDDTKKL